MVRGSWPLVLPKCRGHSDGLYFINEGNLAQEECSGLHGGSPERYMHVLGSQNL